MSRRKIGKSNGERFLGNVESAVVHDLDNEHRNCGLSGVINEGKEVPIQRLWEAHQAGFRNCDWCIGWAADPRRLFRKRNEASIDA